MIRAFVLPAPRAIKTRQTAGFIDQPNGSVEEDYLAWKKVRLYSAPPTMLDVDQEAREAALLSYELVFSHLSSNPTYMDLARDRLFFPNESSFLDLMSMDRAYYHGKGNHDNATKVEAQLQKIQHVVFGESFNWLELLVHLEKRSFFRILLKCQSLNVVGLSGQNFNRCTLWKKRYASRLALLALLACLFIDRLCLHGLKA